MTKASKFGITICLMLFGFLLVCLEAAADSVGKWERYVIDLPNSTYSGNPFLLEVDATFTHSASGAVITLPGYYSGGSVWKVAFMPTQIGEWTYITSSLDADLDQVSGSLTAIDSTRLGMLKAAPGNPRKWKYSEGSYVVPIGVFVQIMFDTASTSEFTSMADFLKGNNIKLINFRLSENDLAFSDVANLQMNLPLWNRLEERMNILAARDIGITMMPYTDDSGKPSFGAQSAQEQLLFRYMVARLASYPLVSFNTGIDLREYRNQAWADWYAQYVSGLDPYDHPISSRHCCGTGNIVIGAQTYNSVGTRNSVLSGQLTAFNDYSLPGQNDDNWSEQTSASGINGHSVADIRRAAWKSCIAGGVGFHVRHNIGRCYPGTTECDRAFYAASIQSELDSEAFLGLVDPFVQTKLGETFGSMLPDSTLVDSAGGKYALADPERSRILLLLIGRNDTWDSGDGGPVTVKLSQVSGSFSAIWFDPRTGAETTAGNFSGGSNYTLTPPSTDDWVLLFTKTPVDPLSPAAPENLRTE